MNGCADGHVDLEGIVNRPRTMYVGMVIPGVHQKHPTPLLVRLLVYESLKGGSCRSEPSRHGEQDQGRSYGVSVKIITPQEPAQTRRRGSERNQSSRLSKHMNFILMAFSWLLSNKATVSRFRLADVGCDWKSFGTSRELVVPLVPRAIYPVQSCYCLGFDPPV